MDTSDRIERVKSAAGRIEPQIIAYRRDLHRYAEPGWVEFRTASLVARRLLDLGYKVALGRDVLDGSSRMGLPTAEYLETHWQRARKQGADPDSIDALRGGFTGVVATLESGEGPTIALRFDMDALDVNEAQTPEHRPFREGFASVNENMMHACGHDAHTAIGLGVAEVLMQVRRSLRGTLKLIFQPAEEGVRGAKAMVAAGVVDGVDYLVGHHVRSGSSVGEIVPGMGGYAATTKFDAILTGAPAHAGGSPQRGSNALLAASTAILNLYAIPRHGGGMTRVNVGRIEAGTGRNVICPQAHLVAETRGATTELSEYMYARAVQILRAAADMHGCQLEIKLMGEAQTAHSSQELAERIERVAGETGSFRFFPSANSGGSEDFSFMMRRVQDRGGLAVNIGIGADLNGIGLEAIEGRDAVLGAHTSHFDLDERALRVGVELLSCVTMDLMA